MLTRRHLLKTIVIAAGSVSAVGVLSGCTEQDDQSLPPPRSRDVVFPQSVASGDPRASSVVLWTRVSDPEQGNTPLNMRLDVATDRDFKNLVVSRVVSADPDADHCVKVRITGLDADTFYYYRFVYDRTRSRVGRTRTAPDAASTSTVRFAVVGCQDYIGRYFNSYLHILEDEDLSAPQNPDDDLNFVVFLGDYIYETTGDSQFQDASGDRAVTFTDTAGTLQVGPVDGGYQAARSLDNYRELYKRVRQDPVMQRMHERFPFINIWDDHEFSDDCWGKTASYFDGAKGEEDLERRQNAEQAFFEFTPIDHKSVGGGIQGGEGGIPVSTADLFPNSKIYRDFRFGQNLQLFMTDFRTYRPDHPIAEDAWPGQVVMTQTDVASIIEDRGGDFTSVRDDYTPYVDITLDEHAARRQALRLRLISDYSDALTARGLDPAALTQQTQDWVDAALSGNVAATVANELLDASLQFSDSDIAAMPHGLAYTTLFKSAIFSEVGSRYFVVKPVYEVYTAWRVSNAGDIPRALGNQQHTWLVDGIEGSGATFKMVASSVPFAPMVLDLAQPPLPFISAFYSAVPENFRKRFSFDVDHWDGFPQQKKELLDIFGQNAVITLTGDVHAAFVTKHGEQGNGKQSVDFTAPAVSSGTWAQFVKTVAQDINPSLGALVDFGLLDPAFTQATAPSRSQETSQIVYSGTNMHGVVLFEVTATRVQAEYRMVAATEAATPPATETVKNYATSAYDAPEDYLAKRVVRRFRVNTDGGLTTL